MSRRPLVSIVTPCLNPGPLLQRCIDSVRAQTYPSIEHLVIDGGSTDGTLPLLRSSDGIRWVSEPDAGQAAAINKGFSIAAGEVLGWLNADDELKPKSIEQAVSVLLSRGAGWVYGNLEVAEADRSLLWKPSSRPSKELFSLGKGGVIPQPGTLVAREALQKVGGLDESFELAMDFDLWLRLIDAGIPSVYVDKTVATFHIHPASKTAKMGLASFFVEEARALKKSGRLGLASIALGRAAAHRALRADRISSAVLQSEIMKACDDNGLLDGTERRRLKAGAMTEAALVEFESTAVKALRHLAALEPWIVKETRARIFTAAIGAAKERFRSFSTPHLAA